MCWRIPCSGDVPQLRLFKSADYQAQIDMRSGTPTLRISIIQAPQVMKTCPAWDRKPVEIDVSGTFADGEQIRDFYSGQQAQVKHGKVTFMPAKEANGLLLLEKLQIKVRSKTQQNFIGKMRPSILC